MPYVIYYLFYSLELRDEEQEERKKYIMRRFMICAPHQTVFDNNKNNIRMTKSRRMRWVGNVARMSGRAEHTGFRRDNEM